jgi:hypothetical protein
MPLDLHGPSLYDGDLDRFAGALDATQERAMKHRSG